MLLTASGDGRVMLATGDILRWMCKMGEGVFSSKQSGDGMMDPLLVGTNTKVREEK